MTHNDFGGQRAFSYFIINFNFTKYFISSIENVLWKLICISMLPSHYSFYCRKVVLNVICMKSFEIYFLWFVGFFSL